MFVASNATSAAASASAFVAASAVACALRPQCCGLCCVKALGAFEYCIYAMWLNSEWGPIILKWVGTNQSKTYIKPTTFLTGRHRSTLHDPKVSRFLTAPGQRSLRARRPLRAPTISTQSPGIRLLVPHLPRDRSAKGNSRLVTIIITQYLILQSF